MAEGLDDVGRPLGRFDLSSLARPLVLRERLADAFAVQVGYGGSWNSPATCKSSFYLLRAFCDFLATIDPPLSGFADLRGGHWNDFQLFLRTERAQGPESLGGTLTIVRTLLSHLEEIPAATRAHIDRWWRSPHGEQAAEPRVLTAAEFDRVRSAARRHALTTRQRVINGWALLERWRLDPSALTAADRQLAKVLDRLARLGDVRRTPKAYVVAPGGAPLHLRHSTMATVGGVRKVAGMLFPTKADLVALAVLFVCETGFNRSVIETLPAGHRRPDGGAVDDTEVRTVATDKPRRGARRRGTHSFVDGVDVHALSAYRLALDITAGAHRVLEVLGRPTDRLLVHWSGQRNEAGVRLQVGLPLAESEIVWAGDVGLRTDPDDDGETQALRATLPELRRSFQVLGRRPAQNTLRTHVRSYLARSAVARDEARDTITAGLTDALAATRAITLARVLTAADVEAARSYPVGVAERFGVSVTTLKRVLSRRADTVLAGCIDFHHSPHAPAGEACPASFLACLACPNALATPGHLPIQVAVHDGPHRDCLRRRRAHLGGPLRTASDPRRRSPHRPQHLDRTRRRPWPPHPGRAGPHPPSPHPAPRPHLTSAEPLPILPADTEAGAWASAPERTVVDPTPDTPVFQDRQLRPLRPGTDTGRLSRFGDDTWDLTPAVLRESTGSVFITFTLTQRGKIQVDGISTPYRPAIKRFASALINTPTPDSVLDRGSNSRPVIAVSTVKSTIQYVRCFTQFLDLHGAPALAQVDKALFLAYLDHVAGGAQDPHNKRRRLAAVERLAHTAPLLPPTDRLPHPAWDDELIADTIGRSTQTGENKFPPIQPQTMSWLVEWSQRFVDRYAADILAARAVTPYTPTATVTAGDHRVWLALIDSDDAGELTELLVAACFVTIAYLSGMRPAEVLNLQIGCVTRVDTGSSAAAHRRYEITGTEFKGVTNPDGSLDTAGRQRPDRWIVIEPVARAVNILEGLAPGRHLFPFESFEKPLPRRGPAGDTRTVHRINRNVARFIEWVNAYCATHDLAGQAIPPDPHGSVHAARFRRTIAWFIARRPGGHLGLGYQYGHLDTATSAGYSRRSNDLGDLIDMEHLLATVDTITTIGEQLNDGERLYGHAANRVHQAVTALEGDHHYTGAFTTQAQLGRMCRDPRLRIYEHPDRMLICAYNPDTALPSRRAPRRHPRPDELPAPLPQHRPHLHRPCPPRRRDQSPPRRSRRPPHPRTAGRAPSPTGHRSTIHPRHVSGVTMNADEERREILAAIDLLLAGTPLRSDGKLTSVELATEADVKRWVLTHKHTDLKDLFNARLKAVDQQPAAIQRLQDRVTELEAANTELKRELARRNQALDAMARWLNLHALADDHQNPSPPHPLLPHPPRQVTSAEATESPTTR